MVTLVEALLKHGLPRPPLTALFTVGEEVGLRGARHVSLRDLGQPRIGFNIDSGDPRVLVVGATGADRWEVDVVGRSSHAGVHPEDGVSAVLIASHAIAEVAHKGYFGKVRKGRREGTSNVGAVRGGEATNQVTDRVHILGESRSHQPAFRREITAVYRRAFEKAARSVRSEDGRAGRVRFSVKPDYESYRLGEETPVVRLAMGQVRSFRWKPGLLVVNGGTDANYLNAKGIPTVTLGAGAHHAHTVEEHADIKEYLGGCRLALALAQTSEP
jgi:tripeptide aminopeptidase